MLGKIEDRRRRGRQRRWLDGSLVQWTWIWANSGRWWRTGKSGMLQSMESWSQTQLSNWITKLFTWLWMMQVLVKFKVPHTLFCSDLIFTNLQRKKKKKRANNRPYLKSSVRVCMLSCGWLFFNPRDCSPPSSSVLGISQARILEQVAISSTRDFPNPGIEPASLASSAMGGRFFTTMPPEQP